MFAVKLRKENLADEHNILIGASSHLSAIFLILILVTSVSFMSCGVFICITAMCVQFKHVFILPITFINNIQTEL